MKWKLALVSGLLAAVVGGCTGDVEQAPTTSGGSASTSSTGVSPTNPTVASTSTTSTTIPPDPTDDVVAAWDDFWSAWSDVRASGELSSDSLDPVAAPAVVTDVLALLERQRETSGPVESEIATSPSVTLETPTAAAIEDCVLIVPSITGAVGVWYVGELEKDGSGWKVVSLRIEDSSGCAPDEMSDQAVSAYESYYNAEAEFWNPPDPGNSSIVRVLAEPQRSFVVELLEEHEADGIGFRNEAAHYPEVIEVRSPTELVILDCYEPAADYGLYDLESDERLPDEPEVRPGQRNLRSAVMVLEDGMWKASDFQGQVDFECDFAPTERGLPSA